MIYEASPIAVGCFFAKRDYFFLFQIFRIWVVLEFSFFGLSTRPPGHESFTIIF